MFTGLFPILATRDLDGALRFYRDLLDGHVTYEFPGPDGRPAYVSLQVGESSIGIGVEPGIADTPRPRAVALWVYAEDCDAAVDRLRAAGVTVVAEPETQPWGERVARVLDPDGNEVIIGAEVHESRPRRPASVLWYAWLRGTDSNRRPSGYEPDELPLLHPATANGSCVLRFGQTGAVPDTSGLPAPEAPFRRRMTDRSGAQAPEGAPAWAPASERPIDRAQRSAPEASGAELPDTSGTRGRQVGRCTPGSISTTA